MGLDKCLLVRIEVGYKMISNYELGSLNENKTITAKFTKYQVEHRSDGTFICAVLEKEKLPKLAEYKAGLEHRLYEASKERARLTNEIERMKEATVQHG